MAEEERQVRRYRDPETQKHQKRRRESETLANEKVMRSEKNFTSQEAAKEESGKQEAGWQHRFTMADVEHLLDEAQREAMKSQGRIPGWCQGDSQFESQLDAKPKKKGAMQRAPKKIRIR